MDGGELNCECEAENMPEVSISTQKGPILEDRRKEIALFFVKQGLLASSEAIDAIAENEVELEQIAKTAKKREMFIISREFVEEFSTDDTKPAQEFHFVVRKGSNARASKIESELTIDDSLDITGNSTSEGKIENFVSLFSDRYKRLSKILSERVNLKDTVQIGDLESTARTDVKIIGMIREMRRSKNGKLMLELEDMTGSVMAVFIGEEPPGGFTLTNDEVVGITGTLQRNRGMIIFAKEIIEPDIPVTKPRQVVEDDISIAFISDIHVGSFLFKDREFRKFISWLNMGGPEKSRELASGVKYLFIAGDAVDGIGIYPSQEKELSIPDIYKQYDYLAKLLTNIPSYIEVVMIPGNHDAVRRVEPQPSLKDLLSPLCDLPNFHLIGSPGRVKAHGIDVQLYHGTSMDGLISTIPGLSYDKPEIAQKEYLKKRHYAPIYGTKDQIAPEERDYMVMEDVPDIMHCGHVHKNGYSNYRGVTIINSGTWQAQTDFQAQQGHIPTPCQVPILELKNWNLKVINFE